MKRFSCIESGALKVDNCDLCVLPYYKTNKIDPNIQTVLNSNLEPSVRSKILKGGNTGTVIEVPFTAKKTVWLVCLPENASFGTLRMRLFSVLRSLEKAPFRSIVIAQFGLIEYGCEDEEKWKRAQNELMEQFADEHVDVKVTMVVPGDDYRPGRGKHFGDGIIPEEDGNINPEDIPAESTHHLIALNTRTIRSYYDYLVQYIDARGLQTELIETHSGGTIESIKDLQKELMEYEGRDRLESLTKWAHRAPRKAGGVPYYPVPSKQKLKLIILLLDMNYEEAVSCLNFFGYGLARFDREDIAFTYMIKTNDGDWKKPIDVRKADATLRKRFGSGAAIIVKQNKKGD